ncbi:MAG TPA: hypothetical protein VGE38_06955 [Nocardioides sp.]|uniref:hypothetical protein n=1 Tax=Nocardioides sp. TaxID=35761 RepID=UPI002ED9BAC9
MRTEEQGVDLAAAALANALATCEQMTPREQAQAAWTPDGPSVDELEDRIREHRGLTPLHRGTAA